MHEEKPATVRVRIADARGEEWFVYDPVNGLALVNDRNEKWSGEKLGEGILYEVAPLSLGMLVISPQPPERGFRGKMKEADVKRGLEQRRDRAEKTSDLSTLRRGTLEVGWADADGDGTAEVRLASKHQELAFGPSGNLWSWRVGSHQLVSRFAGVGACVDQFWLPEEARSSEESRAEYKLLKRETERGRASVTFRRKVTHPSVAGLVIEKTYTIRKNSPQVEVRVRIQNESPDITEFSYRSKNCFRVGNTPTLSFTSNQGRRIFSGEQQPREIWVARDKLPSDQLSLLSRSTGLRVVSPQFTLGHPDRAHILATTELDKLLQLYRLGPD